MKNKDITIKIGSFPTSLGLAFIILKLCNVITWSWWWVLAPFWIPIAFIGLVIFLIIIIYFILAIIDYD